MIDQILKNSKYKISQFTADEISAIEQKIYSRDGKNYMKCQIRGKEIQLKAEEVIRQLFIYKLIHTYGYSAAQIKVEHEISFGREKKRADIVIFKKTADEFPYIIIEVKKPNEHDGKAQLKSYCNACRAPIGVWTNGEEIERYRSKDPNYFEPIDDIPNVNQTVEDVKRQLFYIDDLIRNDKIATENKTLSKIIVNLEDEILANAGVDVFEEVFKLIYTKLYDEKLSGNNNSRALMFRNYSNNDEELYKSIQELFAEAKKYWQGVFADTDKIELTPSHLAICVSSLQNVKLFNSNLEVIDDAFEYLMTKSQKGEKGQYFTPRYVIDMCVKMLNPKETETMIDTAAGSCGFPVHTMFYVWRNILDRLGISQSHLFTLEKKPLDCENYVRDKIFALDFDEKAVRVARTLNLIAGDGKTNVIRLNTLDYERWDEYISDEDWDEIYHDGWIKLKKLRAEKKSNRDFNFDILMANPPFAGDIKETRVITKYELGKNAKGSYQSKVGRDILFIERNLQFLKPGGRMAIVLPQGRFNNSSDKYIRDFISERCRILAVVGLHGNVFKPHTGTKTSVLFVQKWDDELCPRRNDYPIFFATMRKPSKDNSGDKIYVKDKAGKDLRDKHNHLIVEHDLFNHDGLTQDGIAEAFAEFARRENLSFFDAGSFDEIKYRRLLEELECTEILLSDLYDDNFEHRFDSEFILKKYLHLEKILTANKFFKIKDFAAVTDGIHESIIFDEDSNINLISAKAPKENYFDLSGTGFISKIQHDENPRTALKENDVIISTVGTIGNCAVVNSEILPANSDRHVGIVRIQKDFCPRYLSTFILSKFGRYQTERNTTGNVQPNLFIYKIKEIKVPYISKDFQLEIENFVLNAENLKKSADEVYKSAEKILAQALKLDTFKPSENNIAVVNLSASFLKTGRLDAEYYMPKYADYKNAMDVSGTVETLCKIHDKNFQPKPDKIYRYIELANVGANGNISEPDKVLGKNLPSRARRIVKAGQVIISSVEGSLQNCALITAENDCAICSTGFYVIDSVNYNSATLLVLFKSELMQELMKQGCTGTILTAISKENFLDLPLPIIEMALREKIAAAVEESFALRAESERLLEEAKMAVEIAIERGENAAIEFLRAR